MSSKRDVSDEQNERHKKILDRLLREDGNKFCVDCGMRSPTWASVNLGVFMCMTCSGIHRSLGVHISQVRSTKLDTWLPKQVEFIQRMGNLKGNKYWEADLPPGYRRPSGVAPNPELQKFIRDKYNDSKFVAKDVPAPTIENYMCHPYVMVESAEEQEPAKPATVAKPGLALPLPSASARPAVAAPSVTAPVKPLPAQMVVPPTIKADFDLLGIDTVPSSVPVSDISAADPFGEFTSVPAVATVPAVPADPTFSDPFAPIPSTSFPAAPEPAASIQTSVPQAPVVKPAAVQPADPFATLVGEDLISNMQQVSIQQAADPSKAAGTPPAKSGTPVSKTAADILKLYDSPQTSTYNDPFLGPVAQEGLIGQFGGGQLGSPPVVPQANGMYGVAGFQPGNFQPVLNPQLYPQYPAVVNPQMGGMYAAPVGMQQQMPMYPQQLFGAPVQFPAGPAGALAGNPQFNSFY